MTASKSKVATRTCANCETPLLPGRLSKLCDGCRRALKFAAWGQRHLFPADLSAEEIWDLRRWILDPSAPVDRLRVVRTVMGETR